MNQHLDTAAERRRYTVRSTIDAPLTVDASSWKEALALALQLTESEDMVDRLKLTRLRDHVRADDPVTGTRFVVEELGLSWAAKKATRAA